MTASKKQVFQLPAIDLGTVKAIPIDIPLCSFAVELFNGADNSVFLQESPEDNDPNAIEITEFKSQSWSVPWDEAYIRVRTAQPGCTLIMTVGTQGTGISPGTKASSNISPLNRADLIAWKTDVGATAAAIHTGVAIPAGYQLVIKTDKYNDDANPVRIRAEGDSTFYTMYAGETLQLAVNNANLVFADSDVTTNDLHCIVEQ